MAKNLNLQEDEDDQLDDTSLDESMPIEEEEEPYVAPVAPPIVEQAYTPQEALMSRYKALQSNPTPNPRPVSDILNTLMNDKRDEMGNAMQNRNNLQLLALLGKAGSQISQGLTPRNTRPLDQSVYNAMLGMAQQPVNDVMMNQSLDQNVIRQQMLQNDAQVQLGQSDPNSAVSQVMRDLYQKETNNVADPSLSYSDIIKMEPSLARVFNAEQNRLARKDAIDSRNQNVALQMQQRQDALQQAQENKKEAAAAKLEAADEKFQFEFQKRLDPLRQSSKSAIGTAASAKISTNRLLRIMQNKDLTAQDYATISSDMNKIISGSSTISGTEEQSYHTLAKDIAEKVTYIFSKPAAVNTPEIKKHIIDMAHEMNEVSDSVIDTFTGGVSSGATGWANRHPDLLEKMVKHSSLKGIAGGDNTTNKGVEMGVSTNNYTPDVVSFAKDNNMPLEQALAIKTWRTRGK